MYDFQLNVIFLKKISHSDVKIIGIVSRIYFLYRYMNRYRFCSTFTGFEQNYMKN